MKNIKTLLSALLLLSFSVTIFAQRSINVAGKAHLNINNENFTFPQNLGLKETYLNFPYGIALDTTGKIYLTHHHRIMLMDGNFLRGRSGAAGDPSINSGHKNLNGTVGLWSLPKGCAVNPNTNELYIADYGNNVIRKLSAFINAGNTQTTSAYAGTFSLGNAGSNDGNLATAKFNLPYDLVVMKNGDVIVTDEENCTIRKISGNNVTTIAGNPSAIGDLDGVGSAARFAYPRGICKMDENNVLIVDFDNGKIKKLNLSTFEVSTVVFGLNQVADVAYVNGIIYITDRTVLKKFENNATTILAGSESETDSTDGTFAETRFGELGNLIYKSDENALYVVDISYGIVKKIELSANPVVNFTANKTNPSVNQVISITDETTNRKGTRVWTISPANFNLVNGTTLTSEKIQLEFTQTGSYTVKLKYSFIGGTTEDEKVGFINVSNINAIPVADFEASRVLAKPNTDINLIDLSNNNPTSRSWDITPSAGVTYKNSTTSTTKFPVISFANEGKYTIKLTVTNAQGSAVATKTDYITIDNTASIAAIDPNNLTLYPNPTQGLFKIKGIAEVASYAIYNLQGKLIQQGAANQAEIINITTLQNGVYSIVIYAKNGMAYTQLIQKQN